MVGHGPESPRFDRRYARASTCACVVGNDDFPFVGHMLTLGTTMASRLTALDHRKRKKMREIAKSARTTRATTSNIKERSMR
jgi:hypothetical protein